MESRKIKVCCVTSVDMTLKFMLFNQIKYLQSQGYEVHAVSAGGKWIKDIEKEGIKVKSIGFKRKIAPISDIVSFFRLYLYFRRENFQVVHTHTLKPEFFGQIAARFADVPIIINTLHGFVYGEESSFLKKRLFKMIDKVSTQFSDLILSISRQIIDVMVREKICAPEQIKYLGRDIDVSRFDPARFSEEFIASKKKELGIDPSKKVIGIVARMVVEKGYIELFEAFARVLEKFPSTVLLVIGPQEPDKSDAVSQKDIEKHDIRDSAIFLEEREDVDEIYPLMDIFVLPTHREGIGASILEASSMERPVIATRVGGCPESVENGKTGILIPVKDPQALFEAISHLLSNPRLAMDMGKSGREKIKKEFRLDVVLERLGNYYEELIRKIIA